MKLSIGPVLVSLSLLLTACNSTASHREAGDPAPVEDAQKDKAPPQEESVSAATETVKVKNDFGTVEGTLEVPEASAPVPLVIIVSGSGSQDRDGNTPSGKNPDIYKRLASGLRDAGIASLRYDDPGYAKSASAIPSKVEDITYELEVDVVRRWVDKLAGDPRFSSIAIAGHSQGSLSAILVAEEREVSVVSLAGVGRPAARVLHDQMAPQLTAELLSTLDEALAKLEKGELAGKLPSPLDQLLPESTQPYWITWLKYDPRVEIAKVPGAALVVQGKLDVQVSVADAELLEEGKPDAELVLVDDMGHMLRKTTGKTAATQSATYEKSDLPIHPVALSKIVEFIEAQAAR